jgi:hypothetical protein
MAEYLLARLGRRAEADEIASLLSRAIGPS